LLDVCEACAGGRLHEVDVRWRPRAAACVVLASEGYPDKPVSGRPIHGLGTRDDHSIVFHAGTRCDESRIVSAGGRVLAAAGWAETLPGALEHAYKAVQRVSFEGMQYRKDIGRRAAPSAYASAGVSIDAGDRAVDLMRADVRSTYNASVL